MFCTRVYEDETFNKMNEPERMHCFILFYYYPMYLCLQNVCENNDFFCSLKIIPLFFACCSKIYLSL